MNTMTLQSVIRGGGALLALAFAGLLAGCGSLAYNDPNIPASQRYFNTAAPQPILTAGGQSVAVPAGGQPVAVPVGAQSVSPAAGGQAIYTTGTRPGVGDLASREPILSPAQTTSKLGVGDLLTVNFSDVPKDSMPHEQQHRIGDDGLITLPLNVQVTAAAKTPTQLQQEIRKAYVPKYFVNLTVVVKAQDRFVYVDGEVKVPNRQFHIDGLTVLRAISTAGGFTDFANRKKIEVRRSQGGKTEIVNWFKALKNPKLDPPLYVNDQVYVHRGIW